MRDRTILIIEREDSNRRKESREGKKPDMGLLAYVI
jgi:hypothetical protein